MKYQHKDFVVPNISNVPSNKETLNKLLSLFDSNIYSMQELYFGNYPKMFNLSNETFRKMINHSTLVGILTYQDQNYGLSELSKKLLRSEINVEEFFFKTIKNNDPLFKITAIVMILLKLFSPSLKMKSVYSIFAYVGKDRLDQSAQASTGRNLRAILSILKIMGLIDKKGNEIHLNNSLLVNQFLNRDVQSISDTFKEDIINVNEISRYLNNFFDKTSTNKLLSCVATYETSNFIWSKSSLYKNHGEIKNFFGEYIMTVIIKRGI